MNKNISVILDSKDFKITFEATLQNYIRLNDLITLKLPSIRNVDSAKTAKKKLPNYSLKKLCFLCKFTNNHNQL